MRTAAEINELRAESVFGEDVAGSFFDQLALHPVVAVLFEALLLLGQLAFEREILLPASPAFWLRFFRDLPA